MRLSKDIDKATDTFINATLELEPAIRKYNSAQTALGNAVDTISGKVDTINKHIDNVLKEAPQPSCRFQSRFLMPIGRGFRTCSTNSING